MINLIPYFMIATSILSSIFLIFYNDTDYLFIELLPIIQAIVMSICYFGYIKKGDNHFTIWGFMFISYIRYTLCPFMGILSGSLYIETKMYSAESANLVAPLMALELIIGTIFLLYCCRLSNFKIPHIERKKVKLIGSKTLYSIFVVVSIIFIILLWNTANIKINFLVIDSGTLHRLGDNVGTISFLVAMMLVTAIEFVFLICMENIRRKKELLKDDKNKALLMYSLFLATIFISIIIGERRTSQIYIAFATTMVLLSVFPKSKNYILTFMISAVTLIVGTMSVYKLFNVFVYDSYIEAISSGNFDLTNFAMQLDAYFYGLDCTMRNISFADGYYIGYSPFVYDILRSIFGISFFVKDAGLLTSQIFNNYLYFGEAETGYLISSTGYGYIFFGFFLFYAIICLRIIIVLLFEKLMRTTSHLELLYLWSFCYIANLYSFYSSIIPQINSLSRFIVINIIIIAAGSLFSYRRIKNEKYF